MPSTKKSELLEEVSRLRRRIVELEMKQQDRSDVAEPSADIENPDGGFLAAAHEELKRRFQEQTAELAELSRRLSEESEVRKRTEQELLLSIAIAENMAEGVSLIRASDEMIVFTNPRFDEIFGYEEGELIAKHVSILNAPDDQTPREIAESIITALGEGGVWSGDLQNIRKDGTLFWSHTTISTLEHPEFGEVWVNVKEDISERRETERVLVASEEKFRSIFEANVMGIGITNMDGPVVDANDRFLEMIGYSREDLQAGKINWRELTPSEYLHLDDQGIQELVDTGICTPFEKEYIRKDGSRIPILLGAAKLGDSTECGVGFAVDITERKRAEVALRDNEEKYRTLAENSQDYIMRYDREHRHTYANAAALRVTGKTAAEYFGKTHREMGFPDHLCQLWEKSIDQVFASGKPHGEIFEWNGVEGASIYDWRLFPELSQDGRVASVLGVSRDITERMKAEEALQASEEQYRILMENHVDGVAVVVDGTVVYANGPLCEITGYTADELCGSSPLDYVVLEDRERASHNIAAVLNSQSKSSISEYTFVQKDGGTVPVDVSSRRVQYHGRPGLLSVIRDITERKESEKEVQELRDNLAHVTRLSTMGEMATGIAHELNQPLAAIVNYCYAGKQTLVGPELTNSQYLRELLERASEQAIRGGEIIRRLRVLVGQRDTVRSWINIIEPIEEVLHVLESDLHHGEVSVEMRSGHSSDLVFVDEIQIQQVLVNLIRNAIDAMENLKRGQRTLEITTSQTANDMIEVAVCDSGKGIPLEQNVQVFDAFFSTKSEGMGMGLAMSRTIIEAHHGRLWMTTNSDRGVTFHFTLPTASQAGDEDR